MTRPGRALKKGDRIVIILDKHKRPLGFTAEKRAKYHYERSTYDEADCTNTPIPLGN